MKFYKLWSTLLIFVSLLSGCGNSDTESTPTAAFNLLPVSASANKIKTFKFEWEKSHEASSYTLCIKDKSQPNNCAVVKEKIAGLSYELTLNKLLDNTTTYFVIAKSPAGSTSSNEIQISGSELIAAIGYIKASNADSKDVFGYSVSLSSDGNTLAVGARLEDSNATGINGRQNNDSSEFDNFGAVYVFKKVGSTWRQQAYIKASNADIDDRFGSSVSLSSDGRTLAVGARLEDSNATGVNGDQNNDSSKNSGAVYVFKCDGATWSQQAYIKASNTDSDDHFGSSVSLSSDGDTLAVGAENEASNATEIDGDQNNNVSGHSGAVYMFKFDGSTWSQQSYIKASNTSRYASLGSSVSLSSDGSTLAVGAFGEGSNATEFDGDGAVYVFKSDGSSWNQQAYIKASNTDSYDHFGSSVSLSPDGNTLAVGADGDDSNATEIDGDEKNNSSESSGAVYVFRYDGSTWSQEAYIKASNMDSYDGFGFSVSLSSDGNILAVGTRFENSNATGIDGDQNNNSSGNSGAVYLFKHDGSTWFQQTYIKAPNTDVGDRFGSSVALSSDGNTLAVGAEWEDSNATGVNGDENNNLSENSGAVYVY